jgi:hypothetical protein
MRINKDKIYVIPSSSKYFNDTKVDTYMENDFTVQIRCKVNYDLLDINGECFMISRNGKHSGISVYRHEDGTLFIHFVYWFSNDKSESVMKIEKYILPETFVNLFNTYTMICDNENKIIKCYVNNEQVGLIDYEGLEKNPYSDVYYWFGCGSMFMENASDMKLGDIDIDFAFVSKSKLTIEEVEDITLNYNKKYTKELVGDLKLLSDNMPHKESFGFFCDFNISSKYKIWNMVFNGICPIIYMEDNTHY